MKKTIVILLIMVLILACGSQVFAQSQAALIFLLISPSVQANSMGETYLNTAASDPMASVMNPAYLGFFAQQNSFGYSDSKADWLPALIDDMTYQCKSFAGGYTLKDMPVSIGFGYHQIKMDYGLQYITVEDGPQIIGTSNSWDEAKIYSYSALIDYYCRLSIGMNFKSVESHLADIKRMDSGWLPRMPWTGDWRCKCPCFNHFQKYFIVNSSMMVHPLHRLQISAYPTVIRISETRSGTSIRIRPILFPEPPGLESIFILG